MLRICIDKDQVVTKSLVNMLKKFITADIAMKFTGSKKVNDKFIMCNMVFYNCIKSKHIFYLNTFSLHIINYTLFALIN